MEKETKNIQIINIYKSIIKKNKNEQFIFIKFNN